MDISGSYTLYAPREQVWDALLDPDTLKRTIPGCESLEQTGDNQYAVRLNIGVAGVKGVYDGALHVLDVQRPDTYRMVVDGTGARGILHGDGVLRLEAKDAGTTVVHYTGQAQLGGAVASVGMRVAGGAANMLIKQYFIRLADLLPGTPVAGVVASPDPTPPGANLPAPEVIVSEASPALPPPPLAESAPVPVDALMPPPTASIHLRTELTAPDEQPSANTASGVPTAAATGGENLSAPLPAPTLMADSAPASVDALMPPPTAPIRPPAAPKRTALMNLARRTGLTDGSIASEQKWSRIIGAVVVVVVIVIVALVVWFTVTRTH